MLGFVLIGDKGFEWGGGCRRVWGVYICLQAKMVFMMGMYWCARSPETERMRIRGFKVAGGVEVGSEEGARRGSGFVVDDVTVARARDCLLM